MSPARNCLDQLFSDPAPDLFEATNALAEGIGWTALIADAYEVLKDPGSRPLWPTAIEVITFGYRQKRSLPKDLHEFIARIYYCADRCEEFDGPEMDNQIWSFVSTWLGLPYTSDWSPYSDPDVSKRIERMAREG